MRLIFSNFFLIIGLILIAFSGYFYAQSIIPQNLDFKGNNGFLTENKRYTETPTEIVIPAISIDLPVVKAKIVNNDWETTSHGVSYLESSPIPGENGNSILYGHNFLNLLGNLYRVKTGNEIDIIDSNKKKKKFIVTYTSVVKPSQIDVLKPSTDKRITIYTCYGLFDLNRFVVVAQLKEDKS